MTSAKEAQKPLSELDTDDPLSLGVRTLGSSDITRGGGGRGGSAVGVKVGGGTYGGGGRGESLLDDESDRSSAGGGGGGGGRGERGAGLEYVLKCWIDVRWLVVGCDSVLVCSGPARICCCCCCWT